MHRKYGVSFGMKAYTSVEVKKMHVPDFRQILPVSANMLHTYSPFGRTGLQGIHDLIGAVSSNFITCKVSELMRARLKYLSATKMRKRVLPAMI